MSTERPYAPPDDPDHVEEDNSFELPGDEELNFTDEPGRDLYDDERDLEDGDDEYHEDVDGEF